MGSSGAEPTRSPELRRHGRTHEYVVAVVAILLGPAALICADQLKPNISTLLTGGFVIRPGFEAVLRYVGIASLSVGVLLLLLTALRAEMAARRVLLVFAVLAAGSTTLAGGLLARRDVLGPGQPYLNALGLDQSWAVFSPNPRRESIELQAVVTFTGGGTETWRIPSGNRLTGSYWDYHWQVWQEWVLDEHHKQLWKPAAVFIARDRDRSGRHPVRVTLVRMTSFLEPPGYHPDHQPTVATSYYSLPITARMLRRESRSS